MSNKTAILYSAHYISDDILIELRSLNESCGGDYDVFLSYDNCRNDFTNIAELDPFECHLLDLEDIQNLGYLTWSKPDARRGVPSGLFPGDWDFAVLDFFIKNPEYKYYWRVEYDVRFTGDWRYFFDVCSDSGADLLGTTLQRYEDKPPWRWWHTLVSAEGALDKTEMIRGFFPVCRLSYEACAALDQKYKKGWYGHGECIIPTLLAYQDFSLEDIGGEGEFVPEGHESRFYINTPSDWSLSPGTFVYRPAMRAPGSQKNMLWHPIRDEAQAGEWLRKTAERGDARAQRKLGIMLAEGKGVFQDCTESYFWLSLAAFQGHKLAAKWRDGVAKQLTSAQRAAVEERVRCWKAR